MSQNADTASMQQRAMIITLALYEKGRGSMSHGVPIQVDRVFFKEMLCITTWQTENTRTLNQIVQWGWLSEYCAPYGTIFYSLTDAGRASAEQAITFAGRHAFDFVPQSASLFPLDDEK